MNTLTQSPDADNLCEYCRRPWFGLVAFCPYCGREPRFGAVNRQPHGLPGSEVAIALRQENPGLPTGRTASPILFKTVIAGVVAGVIALVLVWVVAKLLASRTSEEASPYPLAPASAIDSSPRIPLTSAADASSVLRTERPVAPRSSRSPCSVAHQTAGLCTSQE